MVKIPEADVRVWMTTEIALTSLHPSRPYPTSSHIHTAPSPRPRSSRSHALRYFGFLSVWPGLKFPVVWPLDLVLLYVYPCNPVYWSRFRSSCFSVSSLIIPTPISIYSLLTSDWRQGWGTLYVNRIPLVGLTVKTNTVDKQTVDSDYSKTIHQEM